MGDAGADTFRFVGKTASTVDIAGRDTILDFSHAQGDTIDLSAMDASTKVSGNQAFTFIDTAAFDGVAGELRYAVAGGNALVTGDLNGDRVADFAIKVANITVLLASDFHL